MASDSQDLTQLQQTWAPGRGFPGVLAEVNNQLLGLRFMVTAFVFFLVGGAMALLMRLQLAVSENTLMGPQVYNELFTMHGSTMMFLFAVPFLEGLALYLLPMMIGARDVAYPRLTAYGYWVYLFGGMIFYASFFFGAVPDIGWFGYTPLSTARFTGVATDFWLLGLSLVEVAGLTAAVELVVTILKFRAPGMTLGRMPLFVWAVLVAGFMMLFAFTVLLTATVLLELDRTLETRFFDANRGGNNLLWQHLFWFFGHPEVYIMFLPASGVISMIVPAFAQRRMAGYVLVAVAIVATGFVSFGLWVHHMFTAGLPPLSMAFFSAASLMIAIAAGIQVFAWIATLWGTRPAWQPPLLFVLGFIFLFVLGGLTGVMVAVVPFDLQVHDTYFVVAHFHYVLIGGVLFPVFAALYFWLPKMTGRRTHPLLGWLSFLLIFVGFNAAFFPMHLMGFLGLPRRVYTYSSQLGIDGYNIVATWGAWLMGIGVLVFLADFLYSWWRGKRSDENPWNADSLEWSIASPPPVYTFAAPPIVADRHPVWQPAEEHSWKALRESLQGEPQAWRATLVTDAVDARPQAIQYLPGLSYLPFWAALGTTTAAAGVLARGYILAAFGLVATLVSLVIWARPSKRIRRMLGESDLPERSGLPVVATGTSATAWWAMLGWVSISASAFAALIYSYFYIRLFSVSWPQNDLELPNWSYALGSHLLLAVGACLYTVALRRWRNADYRSAHVLLSLGWLSILVFIAFTFWDWRRVEFGPRTNAYGSLYFVITGALLIVAMFQVALGLMAQLRLTDRSEVEKRSSTLFLESSAMYGYFTAAISLLVFLTVHASPHLLPLNARADNQATHQVLTISASELLQNGGSLRDIASKNPD